MAHTYDVGTKAWQPDPTEGWVASEVEQKIVDGNSVKLVFQLANGEVHMAKSIILLSGRVLTLFVVKNHYHHPLSPSR